MSDTAAQPREEEADGADDPEQPADDAVDTPAAGPVSTGAESVVAALEAAGAETAFGVQGGAIMPVYDALYSSSINHITMAHEQGAAHAADAYGVVAGEPGLCLATSGPGATNLVTGIADADMDSDAMLALTGQVPTEFVGNDAFQETDTVGVTRPITKHNYFADGADTVGDTVGEAFELARAGRPGPTLVDLPKDVTQDVTDRTPGPASPPAGTDPDPNADTDAVEEAARAIERAERPLCLFGGGVIKAEASDAARTFARTYEIPVTTTMPGIGSFPEDDDLCLSWAGMHGTGYANMAITHTDCLIAVGTRFDDRLTGGIDTFAPEAEVVHVDIDPAEISKNVYADYPLIGDAKRVLEQLTAAVNEAPDAEAWRDQCGEWKETYPLTYATPDDEPLKPQFVVEAFDEATDDDTIVTTGVGQHQMWASQFWTYTEPRTWVSSHGLGTMGYGVPAAVGARVAANAMGEADRDVICFDGDGSFLMTMQELSVAVREDLDITIAVLNNEYIGMVRQWQDAFYEGRHMASDYTWMPEFDKLAEAFGALGLRVDDYDEVAPAIEEALDYEGPAVIDFHVDPEENVLPMVPSGGANGQFATAEDQL
ncbi:acetolactate synthase large subunit [Halorubrum aidingense JCM 13560]|uniref:Acetolactate synthase n=1 Tax=Halorubrum aidingense JCM 13560 TaxID=1230454 RepID=M0PIV3_9EURY|nr:biosynthetic-type acetolactate synthase large subunit [Halorubrum aidingense]EMA68685.1 acetolactate synthase large subunit [Halorubrum aidingense JCM 13560]